MVNSPADIDRGSVDKGQVVSIAVSFAGLWNGTYVGLIQDALGNTGASLTVNGGTADAAQLRGTATGAGLQAVARGQSTSTVPSPLGDSVKLSPEAQRTLSDLLVAGKLLANALERPDAGQTSATSPPKVAAGVQTTDTAALSAERPSQVIADTLSAATAALTDASGFYATAAANPGVINLITAGLSDTSKSSFLAAYADHTLSLQNAADVPGWQPTSQTTLTGTSETTEPVEQESTSVAFDATPSPANSASINFGIGQLYISWPTPTSPAPV